MDNVLKDIVQAEKKKGEPIPVTFDSAESFKSYINVERIEGVLFGFTIGLISGVLLKALVI